VAELGERGADRPRANERLPRSPPVLVGEGTRGFLPKAPPSLCACHRSSRRASRPAKSASGCNRELSAQVRAASSMHRARRAGTGFARARQVRVRDVSKGRAAGGEPKVPLPKLQALEEDLRVVERPDHGKSQALRAD